MLFEAHQEGEHHVIEICPVRWIPSFALPQAVSQIFSKNLKNTSYLSNQTACS